MARFLVLGLSLQGSSSYNAYCPFARYGMVGLQVATPDYFGPVRARVQPNSIGFTVFPNDTAAALRSETAVLVTPAVA